MGTCIFCAFALLASYKKGNVLSESRVVREVPLKRSVTGI